MKLTELLLNQSLIVQLKWGERKIEFSSTVFENDGMDVYLSPYLHNGEVLELNITPDKDVQCNLYTDNPNNMQRISWKNVELTTVDKGNRLLYCIRTNGFNNIANQDDRRLHERTIIQVKGVAYEGSSKEEVTIVIYDISDNGISFYAPESFAPKSNPITIMFSDTINEKEFKVKVECSISRINKNKGNILVGANIVGNNKDYLLYGLMKRLSVRNR